MKIEEAFDLLNKQFVTSVHMKQSWINLDFMRVTDNMMMLLDL